MLRKRTGWKPAILASAVALGTATLACFAALALGGELSARPEDAQEETQDAIEVIGLEARPEVVEPYWGPIPWPYARLEDAVVKLHRFDYCVCPLLAPPRKLAILDEESARAVALKSALKWLAAHQMPDGGWNFDLGKAPGCAGKCGNSGKLADARIAATSLALLAFLGYGQTHKEGKYQQTVAKGLYFLASQMKFGPDGGALMDDGGKMYSHGLGTLALCEAYGMTKDKGLYTPAQKAIDFLCHAQDRKGGGWGPEPQQSGDTTVFVWQIMALKSGHMAYLRVPPANVKKAFDFLDSVQADGGATYGTTKPGNDQTATAAGLLCRMYLGWKRDNPALVRGVTAIGKQGPSAANTEYNYFASQALYNFHRAGDKWREFDGSLLEQFRKSQAAEGHEAGSCFFDGKDKGIRAEQGGRLYCTAMAALIVEVRYRYHPVPRPPVDEDFPE